MRIAFSEKVSLRSLASLLTYLCYLYVTWFFLRLYVLPVSTSGTGALLGEIVKVIAWVGPLLLVLLFWDRRANIWQFLRFCNWRKGLIWGLAGIAYFLLTHVLPIIKGKVHLPSSWIFLLVYALTAIVEEVTFRGFVYQKIKGFSNRWIAGGITAILFVCIHIPQYILLGQTSLTQLLPQLIVVGIAGLVFTAAFEVSDSIFSAILVHWVYDVITLFI